MTQGKLEHANDNCPVERHVQAIRHQPTLIGRWRQNVETGRLDCHWTIEAHKGARRFVWGWRRGSCPWLEMMPQNQA